MVKDKHPPRLRSDRNDDYFNYNLRNARINAGYTLKELARKVGVSFSLIHYLERLKGLPTPVVAKRISKILGKDISEIFPNQLKTIVQEIKKERGYSPEISEDALDYAISLDECFQEPNPCSQEERYDFESPYDVSDYQTLFDRSSTQEIPYSLEDPIKPLEDETRKNQIREVLKTLSYREREVIKLRYCLGEDQRRYTLEEVGHIFKVTRETIRQIEGKVIKKLKKSIKSQGLVGLLG